MKQLMLVLSLFFSVSAFAGLPILQYSWHNQVRSSQLMIFEDGTILHQERLQYRHQTIQEENLSQLELEGLKTLLKKVLKAKSSTEEIEASLGSQSGTIEVRDEKSLKIVEGVVRDSTDIYHARAYRSDSASMEELKAFIFKYTENDMDF